MSDDDSTIQNVPMSIFTTGGQTSVSSFCSLTSRFTEQGDDFEHNSNFYYNRQARMPPSFDPGRSPSTFSTNQAHASATASRQTTTSDQKCPLTEDRGAQICNILIEISPGIHYRLRGANETIDAIVNDRLASEFCRCCQELLHCVRESNCVLCPDCKVMSRLECINPATYGLSNENKDFGSVGLGMKHDELCVLRNELGL